MKFLASTQARVTTIQVVSLSTSSTKQKVEVVKTEITQVKNPLLKTYLNRATPYN